MAGACIDALLYNMKGAVYPTASASIRLSHVTPPALVPALPDLLIQHYAVHTRLEQREHQARLALQAPQSI
jgi:hypothetical protein